MARRLAGIQAWEAALRRTAQERLDSAGSRIDLAAVGIETESTYGVTLRLPANPTGITEHFFHSGGAFLGMSGRQPEFRRQAGQIADELILILDQGDEIIRLHEGQLATARGILEPHGLATATHAIEHVGIVHYAGPAHLASVTSVITVELLGDGWTPETRTYTSRHKGARWGRLARDARDHATRTRQRDGGTDAMLVEAVLGRALEAMGDADAAALEALLRRCPRREGHQQGNWMPETLGEHGIRLPEDVECVRLDDGVVGGRVRLGRSTTWNGGRLLRAATELPATMIAALPGRRLDTVARHAHLDPDAIITGAFVDANGSLRVKTERRTTTYRHGGDKTGREQ